MTQSIFQAQPFELPFDPRTTALVMIDMQRDFVEAGGVMTNVKGVKEWHTATNFLMLYGFEIKKIVEIV